MKVEKGTLSHGSESLGKSECHEMFLLVKLRDCSFSIELEILSKRPSTKVRGRCL